MGSFVVFNKSKIQSEPSVLCELGEAKAIHNIKKESIYLQCVVFNKSKIPI